MGEPTNCNKGAIEPNTHVFVVKVWCEEDGEGKRPVVWRGYITHVASSRRRYVTRLSELDQFIAVYLQELGVRLPLVWRIFQWLIRYIG